MLNSKNITTIGIIVVMASLLIGVFIYFGGSNSTIESDLQVVPPDTGGTQVLSRELLSALSSVKDLKLDPGFFKDTAFDSLIDYSEDIRDEQVGRDNPFLPVGAVIEETPVIPPTPAPTPTP